MLVYCIFKSNRIPLNSSHAQTHTHTRAHYTFSPSLEAFFEIVMVTLLSAEYVLPQKSAILSADYMYFPKKGNLH